jgi:hypothetical protein
MARAGLLGAPLILLTCSSGTDPAATPEEPNPTSPLVEECGTRDPGWIWCDDFEEDRLASYYEYADRDGSFVRALGTGLEGSYGLRASFSAGQVDAGFIHMAFGSTPTPYFRPVDAGTARYREIYWRIYLLNEEGWNGGGGNKLSRATVFSGRDWSQAMIAHLWSSGDVLALDPASGTDESGTLVTRRYNDFGNLRWLGVARGRTPIFSSNRVGRWYCVEAHVRLNDPDNENGIFEFWIDGTLEARTTGLNWLGSYQEYGINALFIENYWNDGSPVAQNRFIDNVVVSTARIGCAGD